MYLVNDCSASCVNEMQSREWSTLICILALRTWARPSVLPDPIPCMARYLVWPKPRVWPLWYDQDRPESLLLLVIHIF